MAVGNKINNRLYRLWLDIAGKAAGAIVFSSDANGALGYITPGTSTQLLAGGATPGFVDPTEIIQDAIASSLTNTTRVTFTYNDAGGTISADINADSITPTQLEKLSGLSIWGNATNALANATQLSAGTDGHVLRRSGTSLGFGTLTNNAFGDNTIAYARLVNAGANTVLANLTGSSGALTATSLSSLRTALEGTITVVAGTTQALAVGSRYVANNASLVTFTLPASAAVGDTIAVIGLGAGGWRINQSAATHLIRLGDVTSTIGITGYIRSGQAQDHVELLCIATSPNIEWRVLNHQGNIYVDE